MILKTLFILTLFIINLLFLSSFNFYIQSKSISKSTKILNAINNKKPLPSSPESNNSNNEPKKKFTLSGMIQLVLMGAGAPGLGDYKGTDENGKMFFELEANNLVDGQGNDIQTRGRFFKDGWVEGTDDDMKPPGFFANLLSNGKLQQEWDEKYRKK